MTFATTPVRRIHAWILALLVTPLIAQGQSRTTIQLPGYGAPVVLDTMGTWKSIPGTDANLAFSALVATYDAMFIPVKLKDSTHGIVGNTRYVKMRQMTGEAMSRFLECGSGMTGANADSYRITMAIVSRVETAATGGLRVRSALIAGGEDVSGPSKDPIPCGSTGALEGKIHDVLTRKLREMAR